ncbi:sulfate transporter [Mycobacterium sp. 1274756.6]|uniref:sulfate transporter n=1 Tax=Mycobacterium sp. 1274756.6 TaxID=1834076 RepID=UPI000800C6CC|nr:sulfate transporter [Mycobacterium sp. 1274756.6]OBJ71977.1 sulfate transporter [Mycobacterium sp. 1274756.6]
MRDRVSPMQVDRGTVEGACLLTVRGLLDGTTYLTVRDAVIKAALDEPVAVLVDVDALAVPAPSAWVVFTSARWHVSHWPDVPIMLICRRPAVAATIAANGVVRYVPVHPSADTALRSLVDLRPALRRRTKATLPASTVALHRSRALVAEWLTGWAQEDLVPAAKIVVDVLVENVLAHTDSRPVVVAESDGETVTIAVQDHAVAPAVRREPPAGTKQCISGLGVVAALSRAWGSTPTGSGKTVWAVIGPDGDSADG